MRLILTCLLLAAVATAGEEFVYKFETGMELVFNSIGLAKGTVNGEINARSRVWVVRSNSDGSHRLVMRTETTGIRPDRVTWTWCNMTSLGIYEPNATTLPGAQPSDLLPPLPAPGRPALTIGERQFHFTTTGRDTVTITIDSAANRLHGIRRSMKMRVRDKLPALIEVLNNGPDMQVASTVRSQERIRHSGDWGRAFGREAQLYFEAVERYDRTLDKDVLEKTRAKLQLEPLKGAFDDLLKKHADRVSFHKEQQARQAQFLNKPSADWETTDFTGRKYSLKEYRGKIVVLDFWYLKGGNSIQAMPQIKDIAAHYKDKPVAVIGMNVDRQEANAIRVIKGMSLQYLNLRAGALTAHYGVQGYPTVVVIDKQGIVRKFHVGFSPTLRKDLIREIDTLLAD